VLGLQRTQLVEHLAARPFVGRRARILDHGLERQLGVAGERRAYDEVLEPNLGRDPAGQRLAVRILSRIGNFLYEYSTPRSADGVGAGLARIPPLAGRGRRAAPLVSSVRREIARFR
jgi:hypothetical protein